MAMSAKHSENGRLFNDNFRKFRANVQQKRGESSVQRLNATNRGHSPQGTGLRTSPGLVAGHYAGCKFSEPPLPSALPLPPKHWMQTGGRQSRLNFHAAPTPPTSDYKDITQQLKMLLKVQA